jgi:SAM-dependent methyltransferase
LIDRSLNWGRNAMSGFFRMIAPFENILDIGAGHGQDLSAARQACPEAKRFAVEVHPPAVESLRKGGVEVIPVDIERSSLPFADESLQVILSNQTLEHVKEIFRILHEVSRTLKPNGYLIIGVPNLAALHNRLLLLLGKQPSCLKNSSAHVRGYTRSDLMRTLEAGFPGGYRLEAFQGSNFYPFPPALARPLARLMPNGATAIFLLLRKMRPYKRQFLDYVAREALETTFCLGGLD